MMNIVSTSTATFVPRHRRTSTHKDLFDPSVFTLTYTLEGSRSRSRRTKKARFISTIKLNTSPVRGLKRLGNFTSNFLSLDRYLTTTKLYTSSEFSSRLRVVLLCLLWYFFSCISGNLAKKILGQFKHPVALTELQFLISAALCLGFTSFANFLKKPSWCDTKLSAIIHNGFPKGTLPPYLDGNFDRSVLRTFLAPTKYILTTAFPLGIFQFVGHVTSHKATSIIPISLVHSIKALSPIVTVAYHSKFKKGVYGRMTYCTLGILMSGVAITCWSGHKYNKGNSNTTFKDTETLNTSAFIMGLVYAFISMVIFVSQNIFAKGVLSLGQSSKSGQQLKQQRSLLPISQRDEPTIIFVNGYSEELKQPSSQKQKQQCGATTTKKIDKLTLLFYCSCFGFLLTLSPFLTGELLVNETSITNDLNWRILTLIFMHGLIHFVQAMLAFQLIGMMSGVNYSIASIMKRVIIIGTSVITESGMSALQFVGLGLTVLGLYGYDRWGGKVKK